MLLQNKNKRFGHKYHNKVIVWLNWWLTAVLYCWIKLFNIYSQFLRRWQSFRCGFLCHQVLENNLSFSSFASVVSTLCVLNKLQGLRFNCQLFLFIWTILSSILCSTSSFGMWGAAILVELLSPGHYKKQVEHRHWSRKL